VRDFLYRANFLRALEMVRPAIHKHDYVEVLTYVCFDGERVTAYNDKIAIDTPLATAFTGAVAGELLIKWLSKMKTVLVNVDVADDEMRLRAGSGRQLRLPLISMERWRCIFTMPDATALRYAVTLSPRVIQALSPVMISRGIVEPSVLDTLGVTFKLHKARLDLFATNSRTISWARLVGVKGPRCRVVLTYQFCEQLVRLAKRDGATLSVGRDTTVTTLRHGTRLFGKHAYVPRPIDFDERIAAALADANMKQLIEIPPEFWSAIDRALLLLTQASHPACELLFKNGQLRVYARKDLLTEITSWIEICGAHPDASCIIDPYLIKRAAGRCTHMLLLKWCLLMTRGTEPEFIYLIHSVVK